MCQECGRLTERPAVEISSQSIHAYDVHRGVRERTRPPVGGVRVGRRTHPLGFREGPRKLPERSKRRAKRRETHPQGRKPPTRLVRQSQVVAGFIITNCKAMALTQKDIETIERVIYKN